MHTLSLQEYYAPKSICFGCGPANEQGLQIQTFPQPDKTYTAHFSPKPHHQAFVGTLNGGIVGAVLDCHCNWSAAHQIMLNRQESTPPCTVTAEYTVKLLKPTPLEPLFLSAKIQDSNLKKAWVEGVIYNQKQEITASFNGLFVAVSEGHPAFHRW